MAVRKIRNSWWVDFRSDYIRYRKRSPENSRAGAAAYELTLRQRLARGEVVVRTSSTEAKIPLFSEFAWTWFRDYVVTNNKPSEQRNKEIALRSSLVPFFGRFAVASITAWHVEKYKAALLLTDLSRKTINNRLTILRKCLAIAYEWLELDGTPPRVAWLKVPPPQTDHLTTEECTRLLSRAEGTLREMILAALRTGMRQGEIRALQWSSIDWQTGTITVRHSRCDYTKQLVSPKSNRARHIPMDFELRSILFKRQRTTGYVFADAAGAPFHGHCIERQLASLCRRSGLRKIGWHTLRHTFASQLAMRGVPLNAVQTLLGHSSITTTMRYAHLAPSTLRTAIEMLGPTGLAQEEPGQPAGNAWVDMVRRNIGPNNGDQQNAVGT